MSVMQPTRTPRRCRNERFTLLSVVETRGIEPLTPALQMWIRTGRQGSVAGRWQSALPATDRGEPGPMARMWHAGPCSSTHAGSRVASPRPGTARPRAVLGAALDDTAGRPRAARRPGRRVVAQREVEGMPHPPTPTNQCQSAQRRLPETCRPARAYFLVVTALQWAGALRSSYSLADPQLSDTPLHSQSDSKEAENSETEGDAHQTMLRALYVRVDAARPLL